MDFIFEVMRIKLDHLFDASNVLDQKISVVVGFLATIVAGLSVFFSDYLRFQFCPFSINLFTSGILFLMLAILFCILAIATKKYYYPPDENNLYSDESLNSDLIDLKSQTVADMKESFKHNHATHERKVKFFNYSLWLLLIALILVLVNFM
jgi:hypothetical protein